MSGEPRRAGGERGRPPTFAHDAGTARYYERRAGEYDEWYRGEGRFASRERPGWEEELAALVALLGSLPAARTVDVACGTAFLSRHLQGAVLGVDRSPSMSAIARTRIAASLVGDALALPLAAGAAQRVFAGHFYGHLSAAERSGFLEEVRRVGRELVVVDTAARPGQPLEDWQERVLNDGSRHLVYKRFLRPGELAAELGGESFFEGAWFVVARACLR